MSKQESNTDADQNKSSGVMHLEHEWILYYDEGAPKGQENTPFESFVKVIGQFSTVQDFWRYWNNIDVTKFPSYANLRLFKKDIKPIWEDTHNVKGGKWLIEPRNDDISQMWLYCILPMIGERFQYSDEICGAVLSFRPKRKSIALWNRDASKKEVCDKTEADLRTFLKLHNPGDIRYQSHSESYDFKPSELKSSVEVAPRPSRVSERQTVQLNKKHSFDEDDDTFSSPFIELTHQFEPVKATAAPSPVVREKSDRLSARAAKYKHHKTSSQQRETSTTPSTSGTAQPPSPQRSYSVGSLQHLYSLYEQHKARRSTRKSSTDNTKKNSTIPTNSALNLSLNTTALVSPRNVLASSITTPPVSRRRLRRSRRSDSQTGSWDKKDPLSSSMGGMTTSSDDESAPLSASSGASSARHHRRSSSSYSAGKEMIIHGHHSRHHSRHYSRDNSIMTPVKPVTDTAVTHEGSHKSPQIGGVPSQVVFICGTLLLVFVVMFCYRMIVNSKVMLIQR